MQNAELFLESGGESLRYIPALNDRDDHISFLTDLVQQHVGGWPIEYRDDPATKERAMAAGSDR
jgi:ferrochelatase